MDRLENMKRNASHSNSSSSNRCALCGDNFYSLRSLPNQCSLCKKILCAKCCIDTQCTLEDLQNSASNFSPYNSYSNQASSSSRRSSVQNSSNGYSNIYNDPSQKVVVYLCRLCSEKREFLKKSGVWFMRKFPNYIDNINLDANNTNNTSNYSPDPINRDRFGSASNLSQTEKTNKNSPIQARAFAFATPSFLRRNLSSSSSHNTNSSSSAFRFWKSSKLLVDL
jgi:hypothetical protein